MASVCFGGDKLHLAHGRGLDLILMNERGGTGSVMGQH